MRSRLIVMIMVQTVGKQGGRANLIPIGIGTISGATMIVVATGTMIIEIPKYGPPGIDPRLTAIIWEIAIFIVTMNIITKAIGTPGPTGKNTRRGTRSDSSMEDITVREDSFFSDFAMPMAGRAFTFQLADKNLRIIRLMSTG